MQGANIAGGEYGYERQPIRMSVDMSEQMLQGIHMWLVI